jgi:hypothetical protein
MLGFIVIYKNNIWFVIWEIYLWGRYIDDTKRI